MTGLSAGSGLAQTSSASAGGYVRPSDWPAVPIPAADGINLLAMISQYGEVYTALNIQVTGGYTVDWGDGTVDAWATSVQAQHLYNFSTLGTAVTSRGYKTAVVKVYPTVPGASITYFDFGAKHTSFSTAQGGGAIWLDITVNTPSATVIHFRSTLVPTFMEICTIIACGNLTTTALNSCWSGCSNLSSLSLPVGFGANVTGLNSTFYNTSLMSLILPAGFGALATDLNSTFFGCGALTNLVLPAGFGSAATILSNFCNGCGSLKSIVLPDGFGSSATSIDGVWAACGDLRNITLPAGFGASATIMDAIFTSCASLQDVVFPIGFGAGMLTMNNAFSGCSSLKDITFTSSFGAFLTGVTNAFAICSSLSSITRFAPKISTSFVNTCLGSAALNALYTALPTIITQTLTVSSNYGYTASTPTIATAKGWTVN